MSHIFEVRPHGANSRLGYVPANTLDAAHNLHRIFGGAVVDLATGWDITPKEGDSE